MPVKRVLSAAAILVGVVCGAFFVWTRLPLAAAPSTPDPALVLFNAHQGPDATKLAESYFEHNDHRLHYVQAGEEKSELIVFIHGFPSFWYSFSRQLAAFVADYHVVAIDGLGAGRSDAPLSPEPYSLENMSAHLQALLDKLGKERAHLIGHDWGAALALGFAQRYPDRVLSVTGISAPPQNVLLDTLSTQADQAATFDYIETLKRANPILLMALGFRERIWRGAYAPLVAEGALSESEGELFREATGDPKRINTHINWYRANVPAPDNIEPDSYWPAKAARIATPMLFIWGQEDGLISPQLVHQIERVADDPELLPIADVGHWPHIQRPDAVNEAIRTLLSSTSVQALQQ
ncbi:MAG: alpha/beta hydrolase [Pseudomonadota bacterium]